MKKIKWLFPVSLVVLALAFTACQAPNENPKTEIQSESSVENPVSLSNEGKVTELVRLIGEKVKNHWPHMKHVWPTYDYKRHNFVLFL